MAIDDFGRGYAGLDRIIKIQPDIIKLDRSLIQNIHADSPKKAFVTGLVVAARESGSLILAEGVELFEELAVLRELNVDLIKDFECTAPEDKETILDGLEVKRELDETLPKWAKLTILLYLIGGCASSEEDEPSITDSIIEGAADTATAVWEVGEKGIDFLLGKEEQKEAVKIEGPIFFKTTLSVESEATDRMWVSQDGKALWLSVPRAERTWGVRSLKALNDGSLEIVWRRLPPGCKLPFLGMVPCPIGCISWS